MPYSEHISHLLYRASILVKAILSLLELIAGTAFIFMDYPAIRAVLLYLLGGELSETPRDVVWNFVYQEFQQFSATPKSVWIFVFLSHGIVKLFLITSLWKKYIWAYPLTAGIFLVFVFYQLYQISLVPSALMTAITAFDLLLIFLILHEYRHASVNDSKK